ncbi:MAG TPA: hypothetical protein VF821_11735, partial [Lentzea sp.]
MSEVNALADRLFDTILDRYPVDASLMGFDRDHASLVDHSEEAERQYALKLRAIQDAVERLEPAISSVCVRTSLLMIPSVMRSVRSA